LSESETAVGSSTQISSQSIDVFLSQLRVAGEHPPQELLDAIRALGEEAVPALIAMVSNPAEYDVDESDTENRTGWAPYSAVTILGELHPPEALQPLLALLPWEDYDYLTVPLTEALAQFGRAVLDPLTTVLRNRHRSVWTRWRAIEAMRETARFNPELRDEIIAPLVAQLGKDEPEYDDLETLRGALVWGLVELHATEAVPAIIRAYEEGPVDEFIIPWRQVRQELEIPRDVAPHLDQRERRPLFDIQLSLPVPDDLDLEMAPPPIDYTPREPVHRATPKIGRNDPCPCGSGKKYKRCHGR
jgi:hypothetical protein